MVTSRVLPPAEWARLATTDLDMRVWGALDPDDATVVVVEQQGGIVATWGTFACRHVEGFWIAPTHRRRGGVLRALFQGMRAVLTEYGATTVITTAETSEIAQLLDKAGARPLPGTTYLLPVDFGPWRKEA